MSNKRIRKKRAKRRWVRRFGDWPTGLVGRLTDAEQAALLAAGTTSNLTAKGNAALASEHQP